MQVRAALLQGKNLLTEAKLPSAIIDAKALLKFCLSYNDEEVLKNFDLELTKDQESNYFALLSRRLRHEPIAYITGSREFYGHRFLVTPDVLIPRNDSETLIDALIKLYPLKEQKFKLLDLGTGSGCLIISALKEFKQAMGVALDISEASLKVAKENSVVHQVDDRLQFIESDLFAQLPEQKFDVILCNPPYIAPDEINLMNAETAFEPVRALFADEGGLFFYRQIATLLPNYLAKRGRAIFEIGSNQQNKVAEIFQAAKLIIEEVARDLESRPRCIVVTNDR